MSATLPDLSEQAHRRVQAAKAAAQLELQQSLIRGLSRLPRLVKKVTVRDLFPFFGRYAEKLFDAYASAYRKSMPDPEGLLELLTGPLIAHLIGEICPDSPASEPDLGKTFPGDQMSEEDLAIDYADNKAIEFGWLLDDRPWPDLVLATRDDRSGDWEKVMERCLLSPELQARTDIFHCEILLSLLWALRILRIRRAFEASIRAKLEPKAEAEGRRTEVETLPTPSGERSKSVTRAPRRGPRPNMPRHRQLSEVVSQHDPWRDHLPAVCADLDRQGVGVPERWKERSPGSKDSFVEQLAYDRKLVTNVIEHALKMTSKYSK